MTNCTENADPSTCPDEEMLQSLLAVQQLVISAVVVTCFVATKTLLDTFRKRQAKMTTVVVGAGPIGLTAVIVAAKSGENHNSHLFIFFLSTYIYLFFSFSVSVCRSESVFVSVSLCLLLSLSLSVSPSLSLSLSLTHTHMQK